MTGAIADGAAGRLIDGVAALALAGAFGTASYLLLADFDLTARIAGASVTLVGGFAAGLRVVQRIAGETEFALPSFEAPAIAPDIDVAALWPEELVLTERYEPGEGELLLEDLLPEVAPDSRVIRLFDPATMSNVSAHGRGLADTPDATVELVAALNALRESVRRSVR